MRLDCQKSMKKNERFFYDPDERYKYIVSYYVDSSNNWRGTFHARNIEEVTKFIKELDKTTLKALGKYTIRATETYERNILL